MIHALLTVLSEPNPDMIIILAGYEDKMQQMLRTNPGLQERFPLQFYFDDYNADELMEMAHRLLQKRNFQLTSEADNTFLFRTITQEDVVKAGNRLRGKQVVKLEPQPIRRIGFRA